MIRSLKNMSHGVRLALVGVEATPPTVMILMSCVAPNPVPVMMIGEPIKLTGPRGEILLMLGAANRCAGNN
jgi:hypothetical protein